ncbi:MAG: DnaJ domain-containing protein [Pseudomonadota bacterium]
MQLLILGIALLVGLWLLGRWFISADPQKLARIVRNVAIVGLIAVAIILLVTGRFGIALAALAFLFPILMRLRSVINGVKATFGPQPGASSGVRTGFLDMNLDHDTGDMDGRICAGRFTGRMLSSLNQGELLDLLREMAADDPNGVPVLEAYLDRTIGPEWRDDLAGDSDASGGDGAMSRAEALDTLGLEEGASDDDIKAAHRAAMMDNHPDQGGSDEAAMRINQAKDILLGP